MRTGPISARRLAGYRLCPSVSPLAKSPPTRLAFPLFFLRGSSRALKQTLLHIGRRWLSVDRRARNPSSSIPYPRTISRMY